jgi:thioredoxin reductase
VCLIERDSELGGILTQCIHTGFGLARFGEELTGPEYAAREAATLPNVTLALETFVTGIERTGAPAEKCAEKPAEKCTEKCAEKCAETHASPAAPSANAPQPASQPSALIGRETPQNAQGTCGFTLTCASEARGVYTVAARAVVLACGSRERGRAEISLAGTRAAGIMTAGCAQRLMNVEGVKLGRRAVVVGSGDIGLIMARRLAYTGVEVACVLEREARPGGLRRNIVQCLEDLDIPLYLSTSVLATHGWPHLTHVTVASLDPVTYQPIAGSERDIACDTLLLSVGLVPEVTLAQALGAQLDGATRGPAVDSRLMTSVPGLFVAGNLLHVHDLADYVSHEGAYAGSCAAAYALGAAGCAEGSASGRKHREVAGLAVTRGQGVGSLAPQWLRPQDVGARLYARSNAVIENGRIELLVDGAVVASKRSRCIVPSEMHFLELTPAVAEALDSGSTCELRMVPAGAVAASTTAAPAAARKERA